MVAASSQSLTGYNYVFLDGVSHCESMALENNEILFWRKGHGCSDPRGKEARACFYSGINACPQ